MKVMRFMSSEEFAKFQAGEVLQNYDRHHARTDAVGFCFLNADEYTGNEAYHFLSGVVSPDVCAIFEVKDVPFKQGTGVFADPAAQSMGIMGIFNTSTIDVKEYSITDYSRNQFNLVEYCDDFALNFEDDSFDRIFKFKKEASYAKA